MNVCVLQHVLDAFKGANHLSLFASLPDVAFTIVCSRSNIPPEKLPSNISVVKIPGSIGSYYYGCADYLFAHRVMKKYPPEHSFWKQFSVIHLNQMVGPAFCSLKHSQIPIVVLIHHPVTADRAIAIAESRGFVRLHWRLKYFLLVRWQQALCRHVTAVATVSQAMRQRIATDYGMEMSDIRVVPNGIDTDIFISSPVRESMHDAIAVGSFVHPRKGFPYLLDVYKRLTKAGWTIADVGRRTTEQLDALRSISGVTVYGTVDEQRLLSLMQTSRVLVSTSLFEGFGLSLIEALACGRPAFAFDGGAVGEVLRPIDPTLVVPLRDTVMLAEKAEAFLCLSEAERRARGEHLRKAVLERYNIAHSAHELQALYTSMASSR